MPQVPRALLFIADRCPHCPAVVAGLARLVKDGRLGRLDIVNVAAEPDLATGHNVRSVPWCRIGEFELHGIFAFEELANWAELAAAGSGWGAYCAYLLENHRLSEAVERIRKRPSSFAEFLGLLADSATNLGVRIGISAFVEELAGSPILAAAVPEIEQLTLSESSQTRADACHFLGICGDPRAIPAVRRLLDDETAAVREIAVDTLAVLGERGRR